MTAMRGIIMLDGPDGAGKSTLARELVKQVERRSGQARVAHSVPKAASDCWDVHSQELLEHARWAFTDPGGVVILDRFFVTEAIYGPVYRGFSAYPHAARHLDRLLHRLGATRVLCAPPVRYVTETHGRLKHERHEEFLTSMDVIARRYLDLWHGGTACEVGSLVEPYGAGEYVEQLCLQGGVKKRPGWRHYDVTIDGVTLPAYAAELLDSLYCTQRLLDVGGRPFGDCEFTGSQTAEVLLVGDVLAGPNDLSVPFYANSGSSLYLAKVLQGLGADEARVAVTNINDPGGPRRVKKLGFGKRVILMGREAEKTATLHEIKADAVVRHPQHARRFSAKDGSWVRELRAAFGGKAGVSGEKQAA